MVRTHTGLDDSTMPLSLPHSGKSWDTVCSGSVCFFLMSFILSFVSFGICQTIHTTYYVEFLPVNYLLFVPIRGKIWTQNRKSWDEIFFNITVEACAGPGGYTQVSHHTSVVLGRNSETITNQIKIKIQIIFFPYGISCLYNRNNFCKNP